MLTYGKYTGNTMKIQRILPGAAGIIALTATVGFVDGRYEDEAEDYSRSSITLVKTRSHIAANNTAQGSRLVDIKPDSTAYLVAVRHGDKSAEVLIDAATGRILLSHAILPQLHKTQRAALSGITFPPARAAA
jgi:hypothetical protein